MAAVGASYPMPIDGAATSFAVELPQFSGPLDLLLSLIREEQVDIYDIPIARIAEQFVDRIRTLALNDAAEYLEMAARLLRIKAQLLLPAGQQEQWEDPRAELVRRLLEYQQMREVVDLLERRGEERRSHFGRAYLPTQAAPAFAQAPLALSLVELLVAVDRVLRAVSRPDMHDVVPRALDVPGAIEAIRAVLTLHARVFLSDMIVNSREPWQVLSMLLGLLELAKIGELRVDQARPFGNVAITPSLAASPSPSSSVSVGDAASEAA